MYEVPRKKVKVLKGENDKLVYQSRSLVGQKYVLGIQKEGKQEIQLISLDEVFNLEPKTKRQIDTNLQINTNIAKSGLSVREQKENLVKDLGTVKAQRKVKQQQSNQVKEENISSAVQITEMMKQKSGNLQEKILLEKQQEDQELENEKRSFLPDFNTQSDDPTKIYRISSIVSKEELESIPYEQYLVAVKSGTIGKLTERMDRYVRSLFVDHLRTIRDLGNRRKEESVLIRYMIYLDALLKFNFHQKFQVANLEEIALQTGVSSQLTRGILMRYYQATLQNDNTTLYVRSLAQKDKYYCYLIVLALAIWNFSMDATEFAIALKLDPKKFAQYAKECGCTVNLNEVKKDGIIQHKMNIALKLPFKLQPSQTMKKHKK